MVNNPGKRITQYEVWELFTKAYNKTANISKAVSGFRTAGIYPINPDKFKDIFENMTSNQSYISQIQECDAHKTTAEQSLNLSDNTVSQSKTPSPSTSVPLTEIINVPIIPKTRTTSVRQNKRHSQILSSSPIKIELEGKQKKQNERKAKKESSE